MRDAFNRREFLAASAAASAAALAAGRLEAAPFRTALHKALIGTPDQATLQRLKAAGFEGIESSDRAATPDSAAAARKLAEGLGMRIHSVLYGWANFNKEDAVAKDLASVENSLRACQAYGAETLLLVPCRIDARVANPSGGKKKGKPANPSAPLMPEAWEFDIEFDQQTGHVQRVVAGDNAPYQEYIRAHNHAIDSSREAVKKLIPVAEKTGVVIALENVWNNLWVKPALAKNFVASFDHPMVKFYFDIGNHVKFAPPQEWIRTLGKLIAKCHVKDFKLNPDGHGGEFVHIREGSIDWPAVRQELDAIGYNGWLTIEASKLPMDEQNKRLDLIIAGK
jgi:hexulose-6-phosphate isomerase